VDWRRTVAGGTIAPQACLSSGGIGEPASEAHVTAMSVERVHKRPRGLGPAEAEDLALIQCLRRCYDTNQPTSELWPGIAASLAARGFPARDAAWLKERWGLLKIICNIINNYDGATNHLRFFELGAQEQATVLSPFHHLSVTTFSQGLYQATCELYQYLRAGEWRLGAAAWEQIIPGCFARRGGAELVVVAVLVLVLVLALALASNPPGTPLTCACRPCCSPLHPQSRRTAWCRGPAARRAPRGRARRS
jgi:hypothetical protein